MIRTLLVAAALATAAGQLEAQIAPSITGAVNAARRSADAANAHTSQVNAAGAALSSASAPARPAAAQPTRPATPAPKGGAAKAAPAPTDTGSASKRGAKGEIAFSREVFTFDGAPRDPFFSLLRSSDLRPLLSDLKLVTIIYDATGRNSVAILRDMSTKDQYRVKVGQTLGRMRVAAIQPKQVNFIVEEFGYSRQESLALSDTNKGGLK